MSSSSDRPMWERFLSQHHSVVALLDSHAALLADMRSQHREHSSPMNIISERLTHTQSLLVSLKQSLEALQAIRRNEPTGPSTLEREHEEEPEFVSKPSVTESSSHTAPTTPKSKTKTKSQGSVPTPPPPPVVDSSGLFTIDLNPTPVEQLMKISVRNGKPGDNKGKRKASNPSTGVATPIDAQLPQSPAKKRRVSAERVKEDVRDEDDNGKEDNKDDGDEEDDDDDNDSFIQNVEASLQEQEQKRQAKMNKKRKRESEGSTAAAPSANAPVKNSNKKQKHSHPKPSYKPNRKRANGTGFGSPNKKRKRFK